MLSNEYIRDKVVTLLPIDSDMYEAQLDILVGGAISKLLNEGIINDFTEGENNALDYCVCVAYQVALDLDLDLDIARLEKQYITRVNTLRLSLLNV